VSLSAISIGKGLQLAIKDKLYSVSPDIEISTFENISRGIASEKILGVENLKYEIESRFSNLEIHYSIEKPSLISFNSKIESIVFRGVTPNYQFEDLNKFVLNKNYVSTISENEIIISKSLSDKLDISIGQNIILYFQVDSSQKIPNIRYFEVTNIFKTDYPDFDNNYIIGSSASLQNIYKWNENEFSTVEINLEDKSQISNVKETLNSLKSIQNSNMYVQSVDMKYNNIFKWVSIFDFNIVIITTLMILIAVISVIISLFTLIFEKVKMIGIMSSLGSTKKSISLIFLYQGIEIILKGLIPANILFLLTSFIQNNFKVIKLNPVDYYIDSIPFVVSIDYIILMNFTFILVSVTILTITLISINNLSPTRNIKS